MATTGAKSKTTETAKQPPRRVVAVGKWVGDRWEVRTSLWRYVASYVVSKS
jgi:hypothetical protein